MLFSGSLRDNIVYGLKDCPPERVEAVAKNVNAHSFISEMENGYDTGKFHPSHLHQNKTSAKRIKSVSGDACGPSLNHSNVDTCRLVYIKPN